MPTIRNRFTPLGNVRANTYGRQAIGRPVPAQPVVPDTGTTPGFIDTRGGVPPNYYMDTRGGIPPRYFGDNQGSAQQSTTQMGGIAQPTGRGAIARRVPRGPAPSYASVIGGATPMGQTMTVGGRPAKTPTPQMDTPIGLGGNGIDTPFKKGGRVKSASTKASSSAPKVSTASKRGDGIAQRGKTRGQMR